MFHPAQSLRLLQVLCCALTLSAAVRADIVTLRFGEKIEGKIKIETSSRVVLDLPGGGRTLERSAIATIVRTPTEPAKETVTAAQPVKAAATSVPAWPPAKNRPFPDLALLNREGRVVRLSSYRGKIIILEPIGMTCPACQAFSGGNRVGGLAGVQPQSDCPALEEYFTAETTGATLDDPRIVWVQLMLYNLQMQAPSVEDLKQWSAHFPAVRRSNCIVLAATPEMLGDASYAMIPGVQLIDRNFVLRSDFRGHGGGDSLHQHLLPLVAELIRGPKP